MATKKPAVTNQPVVSKETVVTTDYLKSEIELMMKRFRNCNTGAESQEVLSFYKKYVNPRYKAELSNCNGCGSGFMDKFKETRDWVMKNSNLFIN